jgi:hypothetical protein
MLQQFLSKKCKENCPTLPPVIGQFFNLNRNQVSLQGIPITKKLSRRLEISILPISLYDDSQVVKESSCSSSFVWLP